MPAYAIIEISVHNTKEHETYKSMTPPSIAAYNGKFIVRGGKTISLEGDWNPERVVVLEFPTMELAKEWWNSEQYAIPKSIRQQSAKTKLILVEGV